MNKTYWERPTNSGCTGKPIVKNGCNDGAIIVGRQLSDGLNEQERLKLSEIEHKAQVNILEGIKVNSEKQEIDENKIVNIFVPTRMSELENDSNYINKITPDQIKEAVGNEIPYISDFYITEEQWATLTWENEAVEPEIPSEESKVEEEDK